MRGIGRTFGVAALVCIALVFPRSAFGAWSGTTADGPSSVAAESLQPPTNLQVSFSCVLIGVLRPVAHLTWTPSVSSGATGYQLDRYKGATLNASFTIPAVSTASYDDGLGALVLSLSTSYTWHLRAYDGTWTSTDAVVSGSTPVICT